MSDFDLSKITGNEPPLETECAKCQELEAQIEQLKAERDALKERLSDLAKQVITDIDGIESEILPNGESFAEWSSIANTKRWCQEILKEQGDVTSNM